MNKIISKKTMKVISIITIILSIMMALSTICYGIKVSDVKTNETVNDTQIQNVGFKIAVIIRNVGIISAVVILMILGIRYMMGSAEEKSKYKETMLPYVVGAVLLFAAAGIAGFIETMAGSLGST